jgi:dTDP-4-amino-4,6-dideoxygalactose transaminase
MKKFNIVQGTPFFHWDNSPPAMNQHVRFSYARHGMIEFLHFLKEKNKYPAIRLLSPQYMCHEVINSLGQHAEKITFYRQREDFSFDLDEIEQRIHENGCNVLLVSHLYGKYCRNLQEISTLCKTWGVVLIEDSAHLPWFYLAKRPQYSAAQFFTYRKLFSIPYGASVIAHNELNSDFHAYIKNNVKKIRPQGGSLQFIKWLLREQAKRLIVESGIEWKRSYAELGADPLQNYNQLPAIVDCQLSHLDVGNFVQSRRQNYSRLKNFFKAELPAWHVLKFEPSTDVPYQFMFFKREHIDLLSIINQFLRRGISIVKGLELPADTIAQLGPGHPFNNQLCLPIHQDIRPSQIDHMMQSCREIFGARSH